MITSACARKKPNLTCLVVVLSLIAPAAGCGGPYLQYESNIVALKYTPDEEKSGPLGRLPPLKIALAVRDQRAASEQDRVGKGWTAHHLEGRSPAKVISQNDPRTILADAMADARHRNGHTVVQAADVTADVLLQVQLKKFMSYDIESWDIGPSILGSSFGVEIEIMTGRGTNRILLKPIRTTYRKQGCSSNSWANCYRDVLNEGLVRFIRSFATDHEVVEALRSVSQETGS